MQLVNGFQLLTIFAKSFTLDVPLSTEYASKYASEHASQKGSLRIALRKQRNDFGRKTEFI